MHWRAPVNERVASLAAAIDRPSWQRTATVFWIAWAGMVLSHADQSLFGYALVGIRAEFGISLEQVGVILGLSFGAAALASLAVGALADRFGRRVVFASCLGISAAAVAAHYFVAGLLSLAILRTLAFSIAAPLGPLGTTYVAETVSAKHRGMVTGILQSAYPFGWFFASLAAVPIFDRYGWREAFLLAVPIVPMSFLFIRWLPESRMFLARRPAARAPEQRDGGAKAVARLFDADLRRRSISAFAMFFLFGGAYAGTAFYFPTYFQERFGYSAGEAAEIVGMSYGVGVVGYVLAAFTGEYLTTRRRTIALWLTIATVALLALIWLPQSKLDNEIWFGVFATFMYGVAAVQWTFAAELYPTAVRASGTSLMLGAMLLGFAVFPLLVATAVSAWGWQWAFSLVVVPTIALTAMTALLVPGSLRIEDVPANQPSGGSTPLERAP
jgi:MFS family permease